MIPPPNPPLAVPEAERQRLESIDRLVVRGIEAVLPLLGMLTDPSWAVRRQVVAGLASLGDAALEPLCDLLRNKRDSETRIAAVVDALVGSIGDAEHAVAKLARDPNPAVVADVAQILGRRRSARGVATLVSLLEHEDDNVAVAAIEALGRVGGRAAVDALVAAVQSKNFFRVYPAIDVLGRSGDPRAVAPLAALLDDPQFALEACRALGRTGERAAVAPLANLLASASDANVRVAAVSLSDLHERYRERFGAALAVEEALRQTAPAQSAVRRLGQCAVGAEATEQAAVCLVLGVLGSDAAVPVLTRLLLTPAAAGAAAAALKKIARSESEVQILRAVRDGDSARRAALLPGIVTSAAVEDVSLCLTDPDASVRALACDALARMGTPRAVPALFARLDDPNPRVSQAALAAIQSLGSAETLRLALAAGRSPQAVVRRAALRILSFFGYSEAFDLFRSSLEDPDARVRDAAIQGLPFLEDPRALDCVLETASATGERVRASAMRALGQCAEDVRVVSALLRGLGDADAWVRYYACQSLGKLGVEASVAPIAKLLADDAGQVRVAAVEALSHLESAIALDELRKAAASSEPDVQRAALIGLGISRRPDALPILLAAAASSDPATRLVALSAVAGFDEQQVLPTLARAASDQDESVRTAAIGFLASWSGPDATRVLVDFLHDSKERDRVVAALATPSEGRVTGVLAALEHSDDEISSFLTSTLARLNRADATAAIFAAMKLPNPPARKAAASTLAAIGTREALATLRRASTEDASSEVRRICSLLLAQ